MEEPSMIRCMCVAMAGLLAFAGASMAQPLTVSPIRTSFDWQTIGFASTASAHLGSASVVASGHVSDGVSVGQAAGSFQELRRVIVVGDTVYIIDSAGRETRGRVATLSDIALTIAVDDTRREFDATSVARIDRRRRDSVRNGLLIGAGAGALLGFGLGRKADSPGCPRAGIECGQGAMIGTVGGAFWGAAGGWIVDTLIRRREVVYSPAGSR
jgi:hypothetical protein